MRKNNCSRKAASHEGFYYNYFAFLLVLKMSLLLEINVITSRDQEKGNTEDPVYSPGDGEGPAGGGKVLNPKTEEGLNFNQE